MSPLFLTSYKAYGAALALLLAGAAGFSLWLAKQEAPVPRLGDYHVYRCEAGATADGTFDILAVSSIYAREIADRLCRAPAMARHYGAVRISWKPRGQLGAEAILNEDYDLIWSREHTLRGLVPAFSDFYDTLLRYDHYRVYWFSRDERPELSREYFRGKKIGLLNDKLSHTLYLLPLESLKAAGVNLSGEELVYFDDAGSLYRAFSRGELDLVSGGLYLQKDLDIPLQRTLIADDATAATLFVRKARAPGIDCEIAAAFDAFTDTFIVAHRQFEGAERCES
ncbi:hypothetical protein [Microbulbifer halophilus]|uniref:Solute-binding protein family 3/N-terminal domain-containing protein n=2 Tax=Microbulbifer halophilus TaxID=453963 RepID=A0ABW5EAK4_9GAMM|nr:hypothetical protein [Microbulbifer halophilus]MCW8125719.1 hypothetical protein [Microbulbifer halophilus]